MKEHIKSDNLPKHIAVIMDGNGRWAKKQGAARIFGHKNAIKAVRDTTEGCAELGVECLTLYAFSTENWSRPEMEVKGLMALLVSTIKDELPTLMKNNISLHSIGDRSDLPSETRRKLEDAIEQTAANSGMKLILALSYSGKWDLTNAMKTIAMKVEKGELEGASINQETVAKHLSTSGFPDPELLIRTSGEMRISNFLLWQLAYTELYFTEVLWPDFRKEHLHEAILAYQGRERRFGKISEQINL
ncbi:isoprenyl transferase [Marinoscillum sp.]|uniref:isoprenyl transferase n=1 Tax=Marinoscillum sp. TaxID=2024838 RepID=UPI003BA84BDE